MHTYVCMHAYKYGGGHVLLAGLLRLVVAVAHTEGKHRNKQDARYVRENIFF